jgi:NarL family two-component system sensor histidine kinase LiaS
VINALRPADLQAKGLTTALRDYVTTWSCQCGITADLSLPEICHLPLFIEEALWRVTQEALSNITRHSHANLMQLHLEWTKQLVSLSITDNGDGFEMNMHEHRGVGLHSMRSRIEQIGGTILIESSRGTGTRIVIRCPLLQIPANTPLENEVTL